MLHFRHVLRARYKPPISATDSQSPSWNLFKYQPHCSNNLDCWVYSCASECRTQQAVNKYLLNNLCTRSPSSLLPNSILTFGRAVKSRLLLPFSLAEGVSLRRNSGTRIISRHRWAGIPEELLNGQLTQLAIMAFCPLSFALSLFLPAKQPWWLGHAASGSHLTLRKWPLCMVVSFRPSPVDCYIAFPQRLPWQGAHHVKKQPLGQVYLLQSLNLWCYCDHPLVFILFWRDTHNITVLSSSWSTPKYLRTATIALLRPFSPQAAQCSFFLSFFSFLFFCPVLFSFLCCISYSRL